ncbi:hypothetical protein JTE90_028894 [Oedothorax gibbosus]|uniref:Leucine-rich repeat-containing protein 20 n=1 Tax=Oedothorax gibbosus TaxID=931172 RepID=A0AAV6UNZ6_9ARAC|nr:hypothetical protein JTE90_028894 [Oedothorax gibbosus]
MLEIEQEFFPRQMIQVAMAGRAVTRVVNRCHSAAEDGKLDLSECELMSFPDAVYLLMRDTQLVSCDLSRNAFAKLPPQLPAKFTHVTALNLSQNRLSSLPDDIRELKSLQSLDLSRNDFMALPKAAFRPPRITRINLKGNFIVDVDVTRVRSAPVLRELNLEDNPLTRTSFVKLRSLRLPRLLVLLTEPKREDDDSSDEESSSPPEGSV